MADGDPVIGIYRKCEDEHFLEAVGEFTEANEGLFLNNRVNQNPGLTVVTTYGFADMDRKSRPSRYHHEMSRAAQLAETHEESVIAPKLAKVALELADPERRHYNINKVVDDVHVALGKSALRPLVSLFETAGRLDPPRQRTDRRIVNFGVFLHERGEANLQILEERHVAVQAITRHICGEAIPCREVKMGHIPRPHVTVGRVHADNVHELRRRWLRSDMPGKIELSPVEVAVFDRNNENRMAS